MRGKIVKHHIYILVYTGKGPVYVTSLGEGKSAYWNPKEKPLELSSREYAEQVALGLTWNGNNAVCVTSAYEITTHPYNYENYEIEWKEKVNDEERNARN